MTDAATLSSLDSFFAGSPDGLVNMTPSNSDIAMAVPANAAGLNEGLSMFMPSIQMGTLSNTQHHEQGVSLAGLHASLLQPDDTIHIQLGEPAEKAAPAVSRPKGNDFN